MKYNTYTDDVDPEDAALIDDALEDLELGNPGEGFEDGVEEGAPIEHDVVIIEDDSDDDEQDEDHETGAPASLGRFRASAAAASGRARAMRVGRRMLHKIKSSRTSMGSRRKVLTTPRGRKNLALAKRIDSIARNKGILYSKVEGGRTISDSRGTGKRLRPAEVSTLKNLFFTGAVTEPQVVPFTDNAGVLELDARSALTLGANWFGSHVTLEASNFDRVPGGEITIQYFSTSFDAAGTNPVITKNVSLSSKAKVVNILDIVGYLVAGRNRLVNSITIAPGVGIIDGIKIIGLPSGYTAKFRPLVPGDTTAERFLDIL